MTTGGGLPTREEIEKLRQQHRGFHAWGTAKGGLHKYPQCLTCHVADPCPVTQTITAYLALVDGIEALRDELRQTKQYGRQPQNLSEFGKGLVTKSHWAADKLDALLVEAAPPHDRLTLEEREFREKIEHIGWKTGVEKALLAIIDRLAP